MRIKPFEFDTSRAGRSFIRYHYRAMRRAGLPRLHAHAAVRELVRAGYESGWGAARELFPDWGVTLLSRTPPPA